MPRRSLRRELRFLRIGGIVAKVSPAMLEHRDLRRAGDTLGERPLDVGRDDGEDE